MHIYDWIQKAFDMDAWWKRESLIKFETPTSISIAAPSGAGKQN